MFDKLKQINELRKMQDQMKKEIMTVEKNGVSVTMNGSFEVQEIKLNPSLSIEDQQHALKGALNEAKDNIQKKLAQSLMGSGFGI